MKVMFIIITMLVSFLFAKEKTYTTVKIETDGTVLGTDIKLDGVKLDDVTRFEFSFDVNSEKVFIKADIADRDTVTGEKLTKKKVRYVVDTIDIDETSEYSIIKGVQGFKKLK